MPTAIATEVRSFVVDNFLLGRSGVLSDDDSFLEKGIIDSTGVLELVSHLEETYAIEITEEELNPDNLDSINKIHAYLARKLAGNSRSAKLAMQEARAGEQMGAD